MADLSLIAEGVPAELAAMTWFNKSEQHNAEACQALIDISSRQKKVNTLNDEIETLRDAYDKAIAAAERCKEVAVAYAIKKLDQ